MSIKKLTYRDIPLAVRARAAAEANLKLQGVLGDPTASTEQRAQARNQQAVIRQWTAGTLPTEPAAPAAEPPADEADSPAAPGASHTVVVDESLQVREE